MNWETFPAKPDREINVSVGGYTEIFPKLLLNQRKSDESWITNNRRSYNFKNSNAKSPLGYLKLVYIPLYHNCSNNRRPSTCFHKMDAKGTSVFSDMFGFFRTTNLELIFTDVFWVCKTLNKLIQHWFWLKLQKCSIHSFVNFCFFVDSHSQLLLRYFLKYMRSFHNSCWQIFKS